MRIILWLLIPVLLMGSDPYQSIWDDRADYFWWGKDDFLEKAESNTPIPEYISYTQWDSVVDSPLMHFFVEQDFSEGLDILIDKDFDIEITNSKGLTPLHHAVSIGAIISASLLVNRGADIYALDREGRSIADIAWALPDNSFFDADHGSDLYYAEMKSYILGGLSDKNIPNNIPDESIIQLTYDPAFPHSIESYQAKLLYNGITPTRIFTTNDFKDTMPYNGDDPKEFFLSNIEPASPIEDSFLKHPIMEFSEEEVKKHNDFLKLLIEMGVSLTNRNDRGANLLMNLVYESHQTNMIPYLLEKGIDVNAQDLNGNTALHYVIGAVTPLTTFNVIAYQHVKDLLENGADPNILNNNNQTPLGVCYNDVCAPTGDIIELLIEYGADPDLGVREEYPEGEIQCVG